LSWGSADTLELQAGLTRAREAATAAEAAHVAVVLDAETSAQEATTPWGSAVVRIRDTEDQATLVERAARERVSSAEVENAAAQASTHEDVEGLIRKVNLLEGELAEERRAWEVAKEEFHNLFDTTADGAWRLVVFERERQEQFEELSLL
jgi:hypothetical protein